MQYWMNGGTENRGQTTVGGTDKLCLSVGAGCKKQGWHGQTLFVRGSYIREPCKQGL